MRLIELLHVETSAPVSSLSRILATAPRRYKVYTIPKRNGKGRRIIAHPARELKTLQRIVLREILDPLPVSDIAMAYIPERGILRNAKVHAGERWILKLDFINFFHSITPRDWDRTVRNIDDLAGWKADRTAFHHLFFWGADQRLPKCLSIGAPTSPSLSNLVCLKLDEWMAKEATARGIKVTRYADDITLSATNLPVLRKFERDLEGVLKRNKGLHLRLNPKKRGIYGPGERKLVTGLVLTPDGSVSIGRARKREIHSLIHSSKIGEIDVEKRMRAKGLLGFAKMAELSFFERLRAKYGNETIRSIMRFELDEAGLVELD